MNTKCKLDFDIYQFYKYDAKTFEEVFSNLPRLIYEDARNEWAVPRPDLYKNYKHYNKTLKEKIIQSKDESVDGVSWMEVLGVAIDNRNDITFYKQFCNILHFKYELAKLYFNSKYAKEDLLNLAKVRMEEILNGIEIPNNIEINYDYKETNNLQGNYRYFLGDVYISLYDTKTRIKSNSFSIVHLNETYDNGYTSNPAWYSLYQNEQNIRHMVKQFIEDMK